MLSKWGDGKWYPGSVTLSYLKQERGRGATYYGVLFDDGDRADNISAGDIKKLLEEDVVDGGPVADHHGDEDASMMVPPEADLLHNDQTARNNDFSLAQYGGLLRASISVQGRVRETTCVPPAVLRQSNSGWFPQQVEEERPPTEAEEAESQGSQERRCGAQDAEAKRTAKRSRREKPAHLVADD